jgi:uncharacterized protein (DUF1697 family)
MKTLAALLRGINVGGKNRIPMSEAGPTTIDYFERRLGAAATARNWNTLIKLIVLTER